MPVNTPDNGDPRKKRKTPRSQTKPVEKYAQLGVLQLEDRQLMSATPVHETVSRLQAVMLGPVQASPDVLVTEAIASEADIRSGLMTMQLDLASRQETLIAAQNAYATTLDALTAAQEPERELERLSASLASAESQAADLPELRSQVESLRQSVSTLETDEQKSTQAIQTLTTQKTTLESELAQVNAAIAAMETALAQPREKAGVVRSMTGHADGILSTAMSPDGKLGASAGSGGTIKIWDTANGKELWQIKYGTAAVTDITFSSDGKILVTAGADRSVRLFDVTTKQEIRKITGLSFSSVAMSPNKTMVATGNTSNTVTVWDAATGKALRIFFGMGNQVQDIQFSPNGAYLTVASDDSVRLLNVQTGSNLTLAKLKGVQMNGVAFSPDGNTIATAGSDKIVHLWDMTGKEIRRFTGHTASVTKLEFSSDGTELYSTGDDATVRVWNVATGQEKKKFTTIAGEKVTSLDAIADGRMLVGGTGKTAILLRASDQPLPPGVSTEALEALNTQKNVKVSQISTATTAIATEQTNNQTLDAGITSAHTTLTAKEQNLAAKETIAAGIPPLRSQVDTARTEAAAAQPTIVRLTSELSVTQATVTRIQADMDGLFVQLSARQQVLREATKIKEALIVAKNAPPSAQSPRQLSAFSQNVVHAQVSNIMGDLIPLGGGIGDMMDAIAEGKTHEEFEALTWNMFANALSSAAGANDGDVLDSIAEDVRVHTDREQMEADIWNGVAERVESLLFAEEHSSDSVALSGTALGDSNRMSLALALENLGGSISINSVNGALPLATDLSVMPGTDAARLLGQLDPNAPAPAALAPLSGISFDPEGWPISIGRTFSIPGLGSVLVHANNGQAWNYQQQGSMARFLNIENGAITSTESKEWWQTVTNFGTVLVRFQNGPQYVSAVSIKHIDATGNAQLKLTDENGVISYIPIDGSGSVKVDKILREFTLDNRGGTYGIENIDPRALVPDAEWEGIATVTKVDGAGTWLDFADAGQLVTEASGKIESTNPNDRITAYVYRGSTKVETIEIGAGGVWSVNDERGFSSIVFRHTNAGSTLFMGDLNVGTDGSPKNDAWTAADGSNNGDIARAQRKQWENSTVYKDVDGLNIYQINGMGGEEIVVSGQIRMEAGNEYPDEYQRLEYRGSPQVHRMLYVNENGLQVLPTSQYRVIAGNVIIIFPGAPRRIVTELWGNGKVTHPSYTKHGAEYNDVMPPVEPTLRADWLYWKEQGGNEGWTEIPSTVSTRRIVAVPGSTLGSLWSIHNDGLTGVDVTVNVHVGQTGTNADPIQRTFTGRLEGMQEKALAVNVGIGQEKDVVTLEIIRSDGITMEYGRRTRAAQSIAERKVVKLPDGTTALADVYPTPDRTTQISQARSVIRIASKTNNPSMQIAAQAAQQLLSATTPEAVKVAYEKMTGLPFTIEERKMLADETIEEVVGKTVEKVGDVIANSFLVANSNYAVDVGSVDETTLSTIQRLRSEVSLQDKEQTLRSVLGWYRPSSEVTAPRIGGLDIDQWSLSGRILLGIYQNIWSSSDSEVILRRLVEVEKVTGIPTERLWKYGFNHDVATLQQNLLHSFDLLGYKDLAGMEAGIRYADRDPNFAAVTVSNGTEFSSGTIEVSLNAPLKRNGLDFDHAIFYLLDENKNQITELTGDVHGIHASISVPFLRLFKPEGTFYIKGVAWYGKNLPNEHTGAGVTASPIKLVPPKSEQLTMSLDPELAELVTQVMALDNFDQLPESNQLLLQYIVDHVVQQQGLQRDAAGASSGGKGFELEGITRGTGAMECKEWIQQVVVALASDGEIDLPNNISSTNDQGQRQASYEWDMKTADENGNIYSDDKSVIELTRIRGESIFESMFDSNKIQAGDIIQMAYGTIPHTMIISKIETDGIWVCDTNFGPKIPFLADETHEGTGIVVDGKFKQLTQTEIQAGIVATHWLGSDNTVRIHFMSFSTLNDTAKMATVYRTLL